MAICYSVLTCFVNIWYRISWKPGLHTAVGRVWDLDWRWRIGFGHDRGARIEMALLVARP